MGQVLLTAGVEYVQIVVRFNQRSESDLLTHINEIANMNGMNRNDIKVGLRVCIVLKQDQRSGILTAGIVQDILTKSPTHPHGIKVRLERGAVGRVKKIEG
jgi:uncharacterized repeat protein (TIGR03833 family)